MESVYIENVSASMVREYLSRKGFKRTLEVFDTESPRRDGSISNRLELVKAIHLEKLMKKNKECEHPFRAIIEVIVKNFLDKNQDKMEDDGRAKSSRHRKEVNNDLILEHDIDESETLVGEGKSGLMDRQFQEDRITSGVVRPKSAVRRGKVAAPMSTKFEDNSRSANYRRPMRNPDFPNPNRLPSSKSQRTPSGFTPSDYAPSSSNTTSDNTDSLFNTDRRQSGTTRRRPSNTDNDIDIDQYDYNVHTSSVTSASKTRRQLSESDSERIGGKLSSSSSSSDSKGSRPTSSSRKVGDLEVCDDLELDDDLGKVSLGPGPRFQTNQPSFHVESKPIDMYTAINLKTLIFGLPSQNFNDEWRLQSFNFCDIPGLEYGIVQHKGGPCGVLASVQACVLIELLYVDGKRPNRSYLEPSRQQRTDALANALSTILWRAGGETTTIVALPTGKSQFSATTRCKPDNITETLMLYTLTNLPDLKVFIKQNINQFELDGSSGVVLAVYSIILTRTVDKIKSDMDEPTNNLMGAHGYCTQDLVNLFLTGVASSNVFNDTVQLDSGGTECTELKGIRGRSDVGLLSLFEHYKSCEVGTYLKTPKYPVWVICSESHFSVLFSLKKDLLNDWRAERRFDVYYYDGLGKQDQEIRLTIDTSNTMYRAPADEDLVPPLEHCIRTKWNDAEVSWNGTEPLL